MIRAPNHQARGTLRPRDLALFPKSDSGRDFPFSCPNHGFGTLARAWPRPLRESDEEDLVARAPRTFRSNRARLAIRARDLRPRDGEVLPHEDLADERGAGAPESVGDGERPHDELEAPRLIAEAVAGRPWCHVAEDDVVGGRRAERV